MKSFSPEIVSDTWTCHLPPYPMFETDALRRTLQASLSSLGHLGLPQGQLHHGRVASVRRPTVRVDVDGGLISGDSGLEQPASPLEPHSGSNAN